MLGCYLIWNNEKLGILYLALGMGMVINSHMISSILALLLIVVAELYRIISRKISLKEIYHIVSAGFYQFLLLRLQLSILAI
ncbi:hypothetical protein V8V50_01185 [Ligilactobacillus salivarius]